MTIAFFICRHGVIWRVENPRAEHYPTQDFGARTKPFPCDCESGGDR